MKFKLGGVYQRNGTNKHGARKVRCVYASGGVYLMRSMPEDSDFIEMLHPSNHMAWLPYQQNVLENE